MNIGILGFILATLVEPLPKTAEAPHDNQTNVAKIELGKQLYFDPRLSVDGTVSCQSCHNLMSGGDDSRANSVGVGGQKGGRSAPTVWNSAFYSTLFWDGRAASLEEQAKGPMVNPIEMGMKDHSVVVERIRKLPGYVKQFGQAFGVKEAVTIENAAKAIAAFERTLITTNSPFDRYARGDKKALSTLQLAGLKLVQDVGCTSCHAGANFSGPPLPAGTGFFQKFPTFSDNAYVERFELAKDVGRFGVTKSETDRNMWRVPTWRNVALTAPYFHNGSVKTLDEAVRVMAKTQLNKDLADGEVTAIVAFLGSLTGPFPKIELPRLPELANATLIE